MRIHMRKNLGNGKLRKIFEKRGINDFSNLGSSEMKLPIGQSTDFYQVMYERSWPSPEGEEPRVTRYVASINSMPNSANYSKSA